MSHRVRTTKTQPSLVTMLASPLQSRNRSQLEDKLSKLGRDASLHFDSDAWSALLAEQRQLIANAAGVDPSKVKIYVGH